MENERVSLSSPTTMLVELSSAASAVFSGQSVATNLVSVDSTVTQTVLILSPLDLAEVI